MSRVRERYLKRKLQGQNGQIGEASSVSEEKDFQTVQPNFIGTPVQNRWPTGLYQQASFEAPQHPRNLMYSNALEYQQQQGRIEVPPAVTTYPGVGAPVDESDLLAQIASYLVKCDSQAAVVSENFDPASGTRKRQSAYPFPMDCSLLARGLRLAVKRVYTDGFLNSTKVSEGLQQLASVVPWIYGRPAIEIDNLGVFPIVVRIDSHALSVWLNNRSIKNAELAKSENIQQPKHQMLTDGVSNRFDSQQQLAATPKMPATSRQKSDSDPIESLLSAPSVREQELARSTELLRNLLAEPTAKQELTVRGFQTKGGTQVREFCQYGTRYDCLRSRGLSKGECTLVHFRPIIAPHTDTLLGDCSYLDTCRHKDTCKFVHYEVEISPSDVQSHAAVAEHKARETQEPHEIGTVGAAPLGQLDAQWIQCDLRYFDFTVFTPSKVKVVMADPPWDIHMDLPYGTMNDQEMKELRVDLIQDEGLLFLWVTGRAMELGRECMKAWGYRRVEEIIWVKTNQLQRIIRTGRTGHWLNHSKEHCLVGIKGEPTINRNIDCDVIVAEVRETSRKPDEVYRLIERLVPGSYKVELFGRQHNVRKNWITLGNQLKGVVLHDPELLARYEAIAPGLGLTSVGSTQKPSAIETTLQPLTQDESQNSRGNALSNCLNVGVTAHSSSSLGGLRSKVASVGSSQCDVKTESPGHAIPASATEDVASSSSSDRPTDSSEVPVKIRFESSIRSSNHTAINFDSLNSTSGGASILSGDASAIIKVCEESKARLTPPHALSTDNTALSVTVTSPPFPSQSDNIPYNMISHD